MVNQKSIIEKLVKEFGEPYSETLKIRLEAKTLKVFLNGFLHQYFLVQEYLKKSLLRHLTNLEKKVF